MKKREVWLDVLRVLAAFLVIVNHTNSDVFQSVTPQNGTWWLSILWYALCKIAVPVFVMVSGYASAPLPTSVKPKILVTDWKMRWVWI